MTRRRVRACCAVQAVSRSGRRRDIQSIRFGEIAAHVIELERKPWSTRAESIFDLFDLLNRIVPC
ncbi:hypothetical protein CFB50_19585 [Burkholderia sp. AU33423]|nr:hypothetical protein WJ23_23175 [Burkholderia lata]OXI80661.1 hypothetical protein CFB50_19585 [Burkholderia sp. AU33423]OXJ28714.1 hypothetical protein CFB82_32065 [Burkholderia sp. HI2714]